MNPDVLMNILDRNFKRGSFPSLGDLKHLLALCQHPGQNVREKALLLLLVPPVSKQIDYYRWLLPQVVENTAKIDDLPEEFLDLVCEIFAFLKGVSRSARLQSSFDRVLRHLPKNSILKLFSKPYSIEPFLPYLTIRLFGTFRRGLPTGTKKRWRIFRKLLIGVSARNSSCELTLADLQTIWQFRDGRNKALHSSRCGRWRIIGRSLLLPEGNGSCSESGNQTVEKYPSLMSTSPRGFYQSVHFPGLGTETSRYIAELFHWQAAELKSVRDLAVQVSQKTRRVVLSLHNASLAAASGWAFDSLSGQFSTASLWRTFQEKVNYRLHTWLTDEKREQRSIQQLSDLREQRLIRPKLIHVLWESRIRAGFDDSWGRVYKRNLQSCKQLLEPEIIAQICRGERYGWHSAVCPHQQLKMDEILTWQKQHRKEWKFGLIRLACMIHEGQQLLEKSQLPHLVLPWIDKFFISSCREEDIIYLPSLLNWIAGHSKRPLILFWEDTSHEHNPSFQLALNKLNRQGIPFRGIGVYDSYSSNRSEACQIVCEEHKYKTLFALRPFSDAHCSKSFFQLLEEKDYQFFQNYDSAWKDDLAFIYAGTQVAPLLSVRCDMEAFPGWIALSGRKYPFGSGFRRILRTLVLGEYGEEKETFSKQYSHWANLC